MSRLGHVLAREAGQETIVPVAKGSAQTIVRTREIQNRPVRASATERPGSANAIQVLRESIAACRVVLKTARIMGNATESLESVPALQDLQARIAQCANALGIAMAEGCAIRNWRSVYATKAFMGGRAFRYTAWYTIAINEGHATAKQGSVSVAGHGQVYLAKKKCALVINLVLLPALAMEIAMARLGNATVKLHFSVVHASSRSADRRIVTEVRAGVRVTMYQGHANAKWAGVANSVTGPNVSPSAPMGAATKHWVYANVIPDTSAKAAKRRSVAI